MKLKKIRKKNLNLGGNVQLPSHVQLFSTHRLQHTRPLCHSPSPRVCSRSYSMNQWCHPTISSSVTHFSSCPQSFPASGSFLMSQLFVSGSQSIGASASASASVLPRSIQGWFPLRLTALLSLQSQGFSGVFSSTIIWKCQFFGALPSLLSSSHICWIWIDSRYSSRGNSGCVLYLITHVSMEKYKVYGKVVSVCVCMSVCVIT